MNWTAFSLLHWFRRTLSRDDFPRRSQLPRKRRRVQLSFEALETRTLLTGNLSISGALFNDLNGNGSYNTGDTALSNWTVFIDANSNDALDGGETSTNTNSS